MSIRSSCNTMFSGALPPISAYMDIPKHVQPSQCDAHLSNHRRGSYTGTDCWNEQINEPFHERKLSFSSGIDSICSTSSCRRPNSQSSLPATAIRPENHTRYPSHHVSYSSTTVCLPDFPRAVPHVADAPFKTNGERKEVSKKAHKESERDRREIENAHIQQLKSLTHSDCYQDVKSKYRDDAAKKEILARGDAFIMALVLRLNLEISRNTALEQERTTFQSHNPAAPPPPDPKPAPRSTDPPPQPPLTHCPHPHCRYSVAHYEAWYDSPLCRRWLDGPDGVIAAAIDIARVRNEGMETIVEASAGLHAAHEAVGLWTGNSLVKALDKIQFRTEGGPCSPEALGGRLEKCLAKRKRGEAWTFETLVKRWEG